VQNKRREYAMSQRLRKQVESTKSKNAFSAAFDGCLLISNESGTFVATALHLALRLRVFDFEHDIAMFKTGFRLVILVGLSLVCTRVVPLVLSFRMIYKTGRSVF